MSVYATPENYLGVCLLCMIVATMCGYMIARGR